MTTRKETDAQLMKNRSIATTKGAYGREPVYSTDRTTITSTVSVCCTRSVSFSAQANEKSHDKTWQNAHIWWRSQLHEDNGKSDDMTWQNAHVGWRST